MERFLDYCRLFGRDPWQGDLAAAIAEKRTFLDQAKGHWQRFKAIVESLPSFSPSQISVGENTIVVGHPSDISLDEQHLLREGLFQLCPWRKGPFSLFGVEIDTEWQSWMKWDRLLPHLPDLRNKRILDIGSSNGYYMFRMAQQSPLFVLGLEPFSAFYYQYRAIQKFLGMDQVFCLPLAHEALPRMEACFDLVFCMGVLYHHKSPVEMLKDIHDSLRKGGEIVLENLVLDSRQNLCLFPRDRYAKMRNVFFIPDLLAMESWLARAGFTHIQCVDVAKTTSQEQRKSPWIQTESLTDFLDPHDPDRTIEGYPAPVRAIFMARA